MTTKFIGRKTELGQIRTFLSRTAPAVGVIYGRRRIGKSLLIQNALKGRRAMTFEGVESQPKGEQIAAFLFQLSRQAGAQASQMSIRSWREALFCLRPALKNKPACIVLDEFQWMANYRCQIVSDLKMVWELYLATIPGMKLIMCGSIASFMTTKVVRSSALYGRTDLELHLTGFHLNEARQILRGKGLDEVIEAYLYFGGVPKYLSLVADQPSVRVAVEELAFRKNGYFVDEYERIFTSHFGRNPDFRKIVAALAACPRGLFRKQLIQRAGVDAGGSLSDHLADLESAGLISSETPIDKGSDSRLIRYRLSDPYMSFYFSFIRPNRKKIQSATHRDMFARLSQTGRFHAWRGTAFERLCIEHARHIAAVLGFSGVDFSLGPYFRAPTRNVEGLQIDLLFNRADNVITLCEMKCSVAPVGIGVTKEVERKVQFVQQAFPSKTIQRVLVVHGTPSQNLVRSGYFYRIVRAQDLVTSSTGFGA